MKSSTRFKENKRGLECLNCKQPISDKDNFCSNCGQVNDELPLSIKQFISEFFAGFFSFDTRFFKTFTPLLFKPGKVSREYIEGKRKKYVNPFQLYLHVTIIFFLMQGLFSTLDRYRTLNVEKNSIIEINTDSISENAIEIEFGDAEDKTVLHGFVKKANDFVKYAKNNKEVPILKALDNLGYKKNRRNTFFYKKAQDLNMFTSNSDFRNSYLDNIVSKISIALFFMLPFFTLFLSLLYIRGKKSYTEHLVFVFNVQTVFFILLIFFTIFGRIFNADIGIGIFTLVFLFYLYKSLRNFYRQSSIKTSIKFLVLNSVYLMLSTIGFLIITFLTFVLE